LCLSHSVLTDDQFFDEVVESNLPKSGIFCTISYPIFRKKDVSNYSLSWGEKFLDNEWN